MNTSNLSSIKLIIFDLDGTLVDTMGVFADMAAELMVQNYGLGLDKARSEYLRTSGQPFFKQLNILFPDNERNAEVAAQFEMNKLEVRQSNRVSEETRDALEKLRQSYKLAISSNNYEQNVKDFVKSENLTPDFSLGFRTGISSKGRKHFEFLCQTLNIKPEEILFIGDSLNDAKVAAECGVNFIAKLGTFGEEDFQKVHHNTHCIKNISELLTLPQLKLFLHDSSTTTA